MRSYVCHSSCAQRRKGNKKMAATERVTSFRCSKDIDKQKRVIKTKNEEQVGSPHVFFLYCRQRKGQRAEWQTRDPSNEHGNGRATHLTHTQHTDTHTHTHRDAQRHRPAIGQRESSKRFRSTFWQKATKDDVGFSIGPCWRFVSATATRVSFVSLGGGGGGGSRWRREHGMKFLLICICHDVGTLYLATDTHPFRPPPATTATTATTTTTSTTTTTTTTTADEDTTSGLQRSADTVATFSFKDTHTH